MAENWEDQAVPVQPVADWEAKAVPVQAPAPRPPAPKGEGTISAISPEEYQKVEAQSERAGTPLERAQGQGGTLKTLPRRIQEATAYGAGASLAAVAGLPAGVLHYSALPAYALGLTKTGDAINRVADAITPSSAQADLAKQAPKTAEGKIVAAGAKFATDVVTLGAGGKVLANTGKIPKWAIPSYLAVQTAGNSASMAHASGKDASQPIRTTVGATSEAALAYLAGMTIGRTVPGPELSNPMATAGAQIAGAGGVGAALQTGQNLVAKGTYDPDRPLMSGVWESAAMFGAASLANTLNQTGTQRAAMLEHPQGPEAYMKDFKTAVDNAEVAHDEGHLKTNVYQGMKRAYDRSQAVFKQLMKTTAGKEAQAKAAAAEEFPTVKQLFPEGKGPTPEQEVKDALQKQGPAEAVSREGSEGGNLPEGREGVGQGQQGEETPREEEVQKEVAKPKAPVKIVDQTSYKGVRQGSLMGPDDEMMVAKDAKGNDIGKLWVTKKPDGFEVRKVEVDPKSRRQGVAEQLYVEAHSRYGAYQGATDQTPDGKAMNARLRETHPEIFEDAQKTKKSPVEPLGEPKPVPIVFKKGMNLANIEKTLATLPEVKEGYTRLFRGSSPTGKFEDTFDSSKLKDVAPTREGEHYTDDFSMADYFRASYGKDASISYLDVPSGQAEQAKTRDREYILPSDKGPVDLSSLAKKGDAYMVPPRSIDPTPDNAVPKSLQSVPGLKVSGEEQPKDIPKVPEKPAKAAPKVDQESTSRRKDLVKAIEPDPMVRAKMYRISGILNGDVDPTEEQIKAAQRQVRRSIKGVPAPLQGIIDRDPERGAIRVSLPRGVSLGPVFERLGRYFGKQGLQRQGPIQKGNAVVALARALDAKGMLQHPYDLVTRVMPEIAKSMVTGDVPAPLKTDSGANRDIPDMDTKTNQVIHGLRSPHKIIESMFPPGEGPNIDQEFVSNRYIVLQKALTDYVNGVHKRYQIPDHSARIGAVMDPYRTKIRDTEQWLVPLLNTRKEMETMLDQAERPEELVKRLAEFDEENAERIGEGRGALQNLYREAKLKIYDLAQTTPEVRVAMYMEPPKKRPAWLAEIIKPNEVEAAKALLRFTSEARVAGSQLGIPMRQDEYITHLFAPQGISRFTRDMTGEQDRVARDILAFHRRQPDSVNLMPSTHAAMAYYVPTISRKIATQPFLNKWYADGKNVYLDQNDQPHYAPNFGKWLQQRITEIEHPPQETVWEKGFQAIKSAEITKDMAFNQRVTIKHLVGKITGLVALHHAYLLPASKDFMLRLARKPENLPLVRNAYERITGKPFEGNKDAKLVQALTTNLISSRQIRNALMEDPLVAEYNQPILNSFFGRSVRGAVQPVLNVAQKTRNILGQPLTAVEAFENELNFLASVHQGQQARLTPEEDVRGAVLNLLDYSFRGGHDASAFLKSHMGRMTALSQTPTKMLENYVDIIRKGFNGEPDIYGSAGGATLIRAIVAAGAVSWLGEKYGKKAGLKLWRMLFHLPFINEEYASDALSYAYHTLMADASNDPKHKWEALLAHRRMQGNQKGPMNLSTVGDILDDLTRLTNSPKAFIKSFPAVKQIESEVGKVPKGYKDTLHYLFNAPTPEAEKEWELMREQKGKAMMRKDENTARRPG